MTVEVFGVKDEKIQLTNDKISFYGVRGSDNVKFSFEIEFYASIDSDSSRISVNQREVSMILHKSEAGPYWPRLTKSSQKLHFLFTDFSKWIDEDEESATPDFGGNFDPSQFSSFGNDNEFDEHSFNPEEEDENVEDGKISGLDKDSNSIDLKA